MSTAEGQSTVFAVIAPRYLTACWGCDMDFGHKKRPDVAIRNHEVRCPAYQRYSEQVRESVALGRRKLRVWGKDRKKAERAKQSRAKMETVCPSCGKDFGANEKKKRPDRSLYWHMTDCPEVKADRQVDQLPKGPQSDDPARISQIRKNVGRGRLPDSRLPPANEHQAPGHQYERYARDRAARAY